MLMSEIKGYCKDCTYGEKSIGHNNNIDHTYEYISCEFMCTEDLCEKDYCSKFKKKMKNERIYTVYLQIPYNVAASTEREAIDSAFREYEKDTQAGVLSSNIKTAILKKDDT